MTARPALRGFFTRPFVPLLLLFLGLLSCEYPFNAFAQTAQTVTSATYSSPLTGIIYASDGNFYSVNQGKYITNSTDAGVCSQQLTQCGQILQIEKIGSISVSNNFPPPASADTPSPDGTIPSR
jgi:hypothetical protein